MRQGGVCQIEMRDVLEYQVTMKRVLYLLLFALLAALGNLQPAAAQSAPVAVSVPAQTQVLILVSVEFGGPGIDQYVAALNNSLKKGGIKSTDIHIEYLGLPTLGEKLRAPLARLLREKYRALEFDLVFCIQQPALNFLLNEAQGLAPRAVVLSAYASLPAGVKTEAQKFVFQTSRLDYRGTLQRALELFPRTDSVIVIQGNSEIELARAANIHDDLAPWQGKLQIEDTRALSFSEIDARLEAATPNTVVMGVGILKDAKGQVFLPNESYSCNWPPACSPCARGHHASPTERHHHRRERHLHPHHRLQPRRGLGRNPRMLQSGRQGPEFYAGHVEKRWPTRPLVRRDLEPAQERRGVRRDAHHQRGAQRRTAQDHSTTWRCSPTSRPIKEHQRGSWSTLRTSTP
jgi:hypothetical protein